MSESTMYDATGTPVAHNAPPPNARRANWMSEVKRVREPNHGKFWQQQKQGLCNELQGILDRVEAENRSMTEGEERWYAATETDLKWLDETKIKPYQEELERLRQTATPHDLADAMNGEGLRAKLSRLQAHPGPTGRRYVDLFGPADLAGFKSSSEFFNVLASGLADPRMVAAMTMHAATMQEIGTNNGSAVVPSQMVREWLDASLETEIVRPRARVYPLTTDTMKIAGIDILDNSGSAPGGFKASWSQENDEAIPQIGKFRAVEFHAKKLRLYAEASAELAADGLDFDNQVSDAMIRSLSWGFDDAMLVSGSGAGQPLSVLNDPSLITVPKESGQAAGTIVYENVIKMFSRLHPASMMKAVFVCSSTAIPQLLSMTLSIGLSGAFLPATKEEDGRFTLLGLPLIFTEKVPVVGTKGDIMLIDFSQYAIALRKEILLEKSNLPGWSRDVMSYRVILRADGKGLWGKAQIPKNGDSRSWAVALATRA